MQKIDRDQFGGWAIDYDVFAYIKSTIKEGSTIIEMGSGSGSEQLAKLWTLYSVEHDKRFLDKYNGPNYVYAPIIDGWYDIDALRNVFPIEYDLLLIDGPPGHIGRKGIIKYFGELFDRVKPIIVDDINRADDLKLFNHLADKLQLRQTFFKTTDKEFGVLTT